MPRLIVFKFVLFSTKDEIVNFSFTQAPCVNESPIKKMLSFLVTFPHFLSEFLRPNLSEVYFINMLIFL